MSSHKQLLDNLRSVSKKYSIEIDGTLTLDASLDELGISSIDVIRIISELEKIYKNKIDLASVISESSPSIRKMFSRYIMPHSLAGKISQYENCQDRRIFDPNGESLSYDEFFKLANHYAANFERLLPRSSVIVVDLEKSTSSVALIIACIISNNGFCVLDRESPRERRLKIISKLNPAAIISDVDYNESGISTYSIAEISKLESNPDCYRYPGNILFTSGSTGEPKGVKLSFDALEAYVESMLEIMPKRHGRWLSVSPLHFDIYQLDFLLQLSRGMDIVIAPSKSLPQQILYYLNQYSIDETILISTTMKMICSVYSSHASLCESLRVLYYGAESCPVSTLEDISKKFPNAEFCQFYGPTENTNNSTFYRFTKPFHTNTGFMPLGATIKNTKISLIDENGSKIDTPNIVGQIRLTGSQLMDGYLGTFEEECRVPVKLNKYDTGDYAYFDEHGVIWFQGRKDDLVKLRGNRISLQEIEIALVTSFSGIDHAVPFVHDVDGVSRLFLAYTGCDIELKEIRKSLRAKLPRYGVPDYILFISDSDIKYLSTGKLDKKYIVNHMLKKLSIGEAA